MPIVVPAVAPEIRVWAAAIPCALRSDNRVSRAPIVAATFAPAAFVRPRVVFAVRHVRTTPIVARANAAVECAENSAASTRARCVCPTSIVAKTLAIRVAEFAATSGVSSMDFLVPATISAAQASDATRRTDFAHRFHVRTTGIHALRTAIVAARIAAERANARRWARCVRGPKRTSVARAFVKTAHVPIVASCQSRASTMASVVRAPATAEHVAIRAVRTTCATPVLL